MKLDATLNMFRAAGEETRLRILLLLFLGELTVTELTQVLGQSQPRVSRHLKILADASLVERYREGAWMFYRIDTQVGAAAGGEEIRAAVYETLQHLHASDDRVIARDVERFRQSRAARAAIAAAYFEENAADWDTVRRLHLPESDIEEKIREALGPEKIENFVDLGAGTGRMLSLFSNRFQQGIGFDLSKEMLAVARSKLEEENIENAQVRYGDLYQLPLEDAAATVVCLHQVLHYLDDPHAALKEAARILASNGRLLVSDFSPHELEFLREDHAHRRLGFSDDEIKHLGGANGLSLLSTETLTPASNEKQKLTVKIWLFEKPGLGAERTAPRRELS